MSNENPNNTSHWRHKLDELEHLPGSSFNRDASWDKLHGRLRGNKKSKKVFWYWVAAACVVLAFVVTILNRQKTPPPSSTRETVKVQPGELKKPLKVEEANKIEIKNNVEPVNDKIVTISKKPVQKSRRIVKTEVAFKVQSTEVVVSSPEQEPIAKPLQIINNNSTASIIPPKKKLNVVHINELGGPETD